MTVTTSPNPITTKDAVALTVAMAAPGAAVTGNVAISVNGRILFGSLVNGFVTFSLGKFPQAGTYQVTAIYGGSALANSVTRTVSFTVVKK
ncbi:Ig-like domain repeat protein [Nocardioides agariphilus]|uniref:Ig-like domain repeat protein n=1 Tax=Nocardioides agariphilus TaxID=433664 RepID=A0A930VRI8_9ACTN|nr:Ig-like domain repeat protein [Nocardioides agariphilus]MBF4770506.1 Ig-like domain repeat protein [Nocardioides agariphilus]